MKLGLLSLIVLITICFGAKAQIITTFAGNGLKGSLGDGGPATSAEFTSLMNLAVDVAGNVYVSEFYNKKIRKINTQGIINSVAGSGVPGFSGDGGPAISAAMDAGMGLAIDRYGNLYIADFDNERIRKVDTNGIITTVAGNGNQGFSGDGGPATSASLNRPDEVSVDAFGNLYIIDLNNARIRKVDTNGIITTVAGNGIIGFGGDGGPATSASLNYPYGLVVDTAGNLYLAEVAGSRLRKVNKSGIITTIAGLGNNGFSGNGVAADSSYLDQPCALTFDAFGNLYISNGGEGRILKLDTNGKLYSVVGNGVIGIGSSINGISADSASIGSPSSLAFDTFGNLYFVDSWNNRVCKVSGLNNKIPPSLSIDFKDNSSCSFTVDVPVRGNKLYHVSKITSTIGWDTTYLSIGGVKFAKVGIVLDSSALDLSNITNGKLGINWNNQAPQSLTDSAPLITLTFYPKKNFSGGTGIWFDSIPNKLEIDTAVGVAATKATFNDGWVLLSDTPTVVRQYIISGTKMAIQLQEIH